MSRFTRMNKQSLRVCLNCTSWSKQHPERALTSNLLHELTFHLHDDLCFVFAFQGADVTPVRASVLEANPPEDHRGVAAGYQVWENGSTASELLVLKVLFAAVIVVIVVIVVIIIVVVVVLLLEPVHHHILSEPLDGHLAARLEAAGEHALLRYKARHSDI